MESQAPIFATIGAILLAGLAIDALARQLKLPRVTLMLVFGFVIGPSAFDLLPIPGDVWFSAFTNIALVMVGFLLGEKFTVRALKEQGRTLLGLSAAVVVGTFVIVAAGLTLFGLRVEASLLLGAIAIATAPAATLDVIHEVRARGTFTDLLEGVVALDDAWGLIIFTFALAVATGIAGDVEFTTALLEGGWELVGAILIGVVVGIPAAFLTGRVEPGEPTLVEALGLVLLVAGIAIWLDVSFILAAIVLGIMVANFAEHHSRPFHAIENIEWPFMVLFFVFAGASLELETLPAVGAAGAVFIVLRIVGRLGGAWLGGKLSDVEDPVGKWMGVALLPQAGVALGLALIASEHFPTLRSVIMPIVIGTTVLFEIMGPIGTRFALSRTGQAGKDESHAAEEDSEAAS